LPFDSTGIDNFDSMNYDFLDAKFDEFSEQNISEEQLHSDDNQMQSEDNEFEDDHDETGQSQHPRARPRKGS
jgi:hypothetical protein